MPANRSRRGHRLAAASAAFLMACGGGNATGGDASASCTSGATRSCPCPSGGYGTQTCAEGAWASCGCAAPTTCPGGLVASGSLHTSLAEVDLTGAPVAVEAFYKQDVDAAEAGCVGHVVVRVGGQSGCRLELDFGPVEGEAGGLRAARLVADSLCPGFLDFQEGTWDSGAGHGAWWAGPIAVEAGQASAGALCALGTRIVFPDRAVTLSLPGAGTIQVNAKDLVLSGDLALEGDPAADFQCVVPGCGATSQDGGGGWCVPLGTCAAGYHDGGDGTCQPAGTCSPGYHDDGTSVCAPLGTCADGYHDGGDGSCRSLGTCAPGFHDDGLGTCVSGTACAPGFAWDGGRMLCTAFALAGYPVKSRDDFFAAALANGGALIGGGYSSWEGRVLDDFETWNPATSAWTLGGAMVHARTGSRAVSLADGRVLVAGGWDPSHVLEAETYDPATGAFTPAGTMTAPRGYFTLTRLGDGRVLAVGGQSSPATAELWDPATGVWTRVASLNLPRQYHSATLLADGRVLVVGGYDSGALAVPEIYDPTSDRWTLAASMAEGRYYLAMARLPDDSVVVFGGTGGVPSSAERYDPVANRWTSAGPVRGLPFTDSAALLPSGKVLVLENGGTANEIYDPATDSSIAAGATIPALSNVRALGLADGHVMALGYPGPAQVYVGPQ